MKKIREWLVGHTLKGAKSNEKNLQILIQGDVCKVYRSGKVTPESESCEEMRAEEGKALIKEIYKLCVSNKKKLSPFNTPVVKTDIPRTKSEASWGYHVLINNLTPTFIVMTLTATLTDKEVAEVQKICDETPSTTEELLEIADQNGYLDDIAGSEDTTLDA